MSDDEIDFVAWFMAAAGALPATLLTIWQGWFGGIFFVVLCAGSAAVRVWQAHDDPA